MDTHKEIITLRKEISALRWKISYNLPGLDTRDRELYRRRTEAFDQKTEELKEQLANPNQDA